MATDPDISLRFLRDVLDRLARVGASGSWSDDLNPVQRAALVYLSRANRFSRSPSQVADYLLATRGTVSQTLKSLTQKELVEQHRSETDRRSITYVLTEAGVARVTQKTDLDAAIESLPADHREELAAALSDLLRSALAARDGRSFGLCRSCRHHRPGSGPEGGAWCALLDLPLAPEETGQICHEHEWVRAA